MNAIENVDYTAILRSNIDSARTLLRGLRSYPSAPSIRPLLSALRDAEIKITQQKFGTVRLILNSALKQNQEVSKFDPGDSAARTICKSVFTILRASAQNVIDNILKIPPLPETIQIPKCSYPSPEALNFPNLRISAPLSPVSETSFEPLHIDLNPKPKSPKLAPTALKAKSYRSLSSQKRFNPISRRSTSTPSNSLHTPPPQEEDPTEFDFEPFDEWTPEDEANFDYQTYLGCFNDN